MRLAAPVELSPEQRTALERMAPQGSLPVRLVERAWMVLLAAEGLENNQIARRMHITPEKVARWRSRFLAGGIAAV
jgi:DNA-binding NarL/FixJ family response regulator